MPFRQKKKTENGEELELSEKNDEATSEKPCHEEPHDDDEDDVFDSELLSQLSFSGDKASSSCSTAAAGKLRSDVQGVGGIDGKPESIVLIQGSEAHLFFGFFTESRWGWNVSGPLAGVPPSIYAPVAFVGASLTQLKVRRKLERTILLQRNQRIT